LDNALNLLIDPEQAKNFETTMKKLMKSYEMLKGDPYLRDYLSDYEWLVKIYVAYNKRFKKANVDQLRIEELSKKTVKLIQKTIDVKEIENIYPTLSIDDKYIELLKKTRPKNIGAAIDVIANIRHEIIIHPRSPFFINLRKEVEETYKRLRARKIETEKVIQRIYNFAERIAKWKKEEKEIGKDKYAIYEALKTIVPDMDKQRALVFIDELLTRLRSRKLLFEGWQMQREIRRKVKAEIHLLKYF